MSETMTTAKDKNKANGTTPDTAVVVAETGTAIAKVDGNVQRFKTVDLENAGLPNLEDASVLPMDLMSTYWTPETPGESKNVVFSHIDDSELIDPDSGEIKMLPVPLISLSKRTVRYHLSGMQVKDLWAQSNHQRS